MTDKTRSMVVGSRSLPGCIGAMAAALLTSAAGAAQPRLTITQLTSSVGCASQFATPGAAYPAMNGNGQRIAFASTCDLVPGGNSDANAELYYMMTNGTGLQQLTSTLGGLGVQHCAMNSPGTRIAFGSDRDLVPGGNTDGNSEIFAISVDGTGLVQLTHSTGGLLGSSYPQYSAAGNKIVFASDRDLLPGNNTDLNSEIFVMNSNGSGLTQVTHTLGNYGNGEPSLDGTGTKILFDSDLELVPGGNPDANIELYTINVNGTGLVQRTHSSTGTGYVAPRWTADTSTVVVTSDNDLTGNNNDENFEVFRMNLDGSNPIQITSSGGDYIGSRAWSISSDAKTIAIHSPRDLVPASNADANFEVYTAKLTP